MDIINKVLIKKVFFFDLDGTLVDSSPRHASAFKQVLAAHHPKICKTFDYELIKGKATPAVFHELGIAAPDEVEFLTSEKRRFYLEDIHRGRISVFPGAIEILRLLSSKRREIYIVTSAAKNTAHVMLKTAGFMPFIQGVITSEDVKRNKPYPDIFNFALKKSGKKPQDVLVIEDSLPGKTAAEKAGLDSLLVNQGFTNILSSHFDTLETLYFYIKKNFEE